MFMDASVLMSRLVYHVRFRAVNGKSEKIQNAARPVINGGSRHILPESEAQDASLAEDSRI